MSDTGNAKCELVHSTGRCNAVLPHLRRNERIDRGGSRKLGIRFGRPDMVRRFQASARSGFYLAVTREGEVAAADGIERIAHDAHGLTVADVMALYVADAANQALLERASEHPVLPAGWRDHFRQRRWQPDG